MELHFSFWIGLLEGNVPLYLHIVKIIDSFCFDCSTLIEGNWGLILDVNLDHDEEAPGTLLFLSSS